MELLDLKNIKTDMLNGPIATELVQYQISQGVLAVKFAFVIQ